MLLRLTESGVRDTLVLYFNKIEDSPTLSEAKVGEIFVSVGGVKLRLKRDAKHRFVTEKTQQRF